MIEERILDFLDGRLGHSDEEELLHTLAISPERRGMLKEHMRLRELSQGLSRSSELTVPCPTTAGLFAHLSEQGFTGPVPMPLSMPIAPILPTLPTAIPATTGLRYMYVTAGVIVAFLAGLSVSLLNSRSNAPTRFVHDTTVVGSLPKLSEAQSPTTSGDAPIGSTLVGTPAPSQRTRSTNSGFASQNVAQSASNHSGSSIASHQNSKSPKQIVASETTKQISKNEFANDLAAVNPITEVSLESAWIARDPSVFGSNIEKQRVPIMMHDGDAAVPSRLPFSLSARTGAGPVPNGPFTYVNSLSEAKFAWQPLSWLVAKASLGMLSAYETMASDQGFDPNSGVRSIGTQSIKTFIPIGSLELGVLVPVFGQPIELAGGAGTDASGVIYPRASIFTSISLTHSLSMNLGIEAMTFTHDITSSFIQTKQSFAGTNLAVSDHATSERSGFIGPSIEFSWHP